ncbi:MAG: multicopper oxidase domain-containing protein [Gammaproteobacteria bacterium]
MLQEVLFAAIAAFTLVVSGVAPVVARSHDGLRPVQSNDNRRPAGTTPDGSLVLQLRAAFGGWRPEGEAGLKLSIKALGEESGPLQVPAPLIRVREGQAIVASVQNDLDAILRVHGWCARDGSPCVPLEVPAGARREVSFQSGRAGTYQYWATTGVPQRFRAAGDTQLSGAFIVDPVGPTFADRVLVNHQVDEPHARAAVRGGRSG